MIQAFRDREREITLNAPKGSIVVSDENFRSEDYPKGKFYMGAALLRHHLEFLLVLKGVKPCVLFGKCSASNFPLFATVVIDCLVPIMDRLDLWSYGFRISYQSACWVFYDAQSPKMPLISKAFLVHPKVKALDPVTYHKAGYPGLPDSESGAALGYPVPFDDFQSGLYVTIRDATELDVLATRGWSEDEQCCVQQMAFTSPAGDKSVWKKVLDFYRQCYEAAKSVGTELVLGTDENPEIIAYLQENPGQLAGLSCLGGPTPSVPPIEEQLAAMARDIEKWENMTVDEARAVLAMMGLTLEATDENEQAQDDQV